MNLNEPETSFVFLLTDLTQTQKQASIIFLGMCQTETGQVLVWVFLKFNMIARRGGGEERQGESILARQKPGARIKSSLGSGSTTTHLVCSCVYTWHKIEPHSNVKHNRQSVFLSILKPSSTL